VTRVASGRSEDPVILVLDDTDAIIRLLTLELSSHGLNVVGAPVGEEAFRAIEEHHPALILVEVLLPGVSGFEVMREIKERYDLPILFLTTIDSDADREQAMELGAVDYITKPFRPDDLSNRINLILRRSARPGEAMLTLEHGDVVLDLTRRMVRRGTHLLSLSTNEWAILLALATRLGQHIDAGDISERVWGRELRTQPEYLDAYIRRLRIKIEDDPAQPEIVVGDRDAGFALRARRRSDEG
jgi:DNA-binding response OmpR family regulator